MIYKKIVITAKKGTVQGVAGPESRGTESFDLYDPLPPNIRSHIDVVAEFIVNQVRGEQRADDMQVKMEFIEPVTVEPQEGTTVSLGGEPGIGNDDDWPELPLLEGMEIPDFRKMEQGHIVWYIDDADDALDLIADVEANTGKKIGKTLPIERVRERAKDIVFKHCGIKG